GHLERPVVVEVVAVPQPGRHVGRGHVGGAGEGEGDRRARRTRPAVAERGRGRRDVGDGDDGGVGGGQPGGVGNGEGGGVGAVVGVHVRRGERPAGRAAVAEGPRVAQARPRRRPREGDRAALVGRLVRARVRGRRGAGRGGDGDGGRVV